MAFERRTKEGKRFGTQRCDVLGGGLLGLSTLGLALSM